MKTLKITDNKETFTFVCRALEGLSKETQEKFNNDLFEIKELNVDLKINGVEFDLPKFLIETYKYMDKHLDDLVENELKERTTDRINSIHSALEKIKESAEGLALDIRLEKSI